MKIVFICQPEYFRQCLFDAIAVGQADSIWVQSSHSDTVLKALEALLQIPPCIAVMFRPEWLSWFPEAYDKAKTHGVKFVGYSSEPLPQDDVDNPHPDQLVRFDSLFAAADIGLEGLIHYDEVSASLIRNSFSCPVDFSPLPISKMLFKDTPPQPKDFDAIFLGRSTAHREELLDGLKCHTNVLHVAHGLLDEEASKFYRRSKFSINIHVESYTNTEVRVFQSLLSGTPVITEPLTYKYLEMIDGVVRGTSRDEILEIVTTETVPVDMAQVHECWSQHFDVNILINKVRALCD